MEQTKYSEIILSSCKRNFGTNENPVFILENPKLIQKYKVKSIQIPISYYLIDSTNNKVYFTERVKNNVGDFVSTDCVATLTSQNYTITTLIAEIKKQMEISSANILTYTVADIAAQNKISITVSDDQTFIYTINAANDKIIFYEHTGENDGCNATMITGNYTLAQLLTEIGRAMTTVSHNTWTYTATKVSDKLNITLSGHQEGETFNLTINGAANVSTYLSGLILIDYETANPTIGTNNMTNARVFNFALKFLNKQYACDYILGFVPNTDTSYGTVVSSTNVYDLSGTNLINIGCSNISSGVDYINSYYNVLSTVPITNSFNDVIYWENNGDYIEIGQNLSQLSFFLRDQYDKEINLNSKIWNIILSIIS